MDTIKEFKTMELFKSIKELLNPLTEDLETKFTINADKNIYDKLCNFVTSECKNTFNYINKTLNSGQIINTIDTDINSCKIFIPGIGHFTIILSEYIKGFSIELDLIKSIITLKKELKKEDSTIYNLWIDSIHHNVFDKFRRYRGDKSAFGLYEKEITLSYKEINDICFEGAKDFIDKISVLNINYK